MTDPDDSTGSGQMMVRLSRTGTAGEVRLIRLFLLLSIALMLCVPVLSDAARKQETETDETFLESEYGVSGRDPWAYETTEEMYAIKEWREADQQLLELIQIVGRVVESGARIEGEDLWARLLDLNPYRHATEVQAAIPRWAETAAKTLLQDASIAPSAAAREADEIYKEGKFEDASQKYRYILSRFPGDLDVRNNLALAQMHLGNDLIAQIEWEILLNLNKDYVPAKINLTVLHERGGRRDAAEKLARGLMSDHKAVPMIAFNHAWFLSLAGKHAETVDLLEPLADKGIAKKYSDFLDLNKRKLGRITDPSWEKLPYMPGFIPPVLAFMQKGFVGWVNQGEVEFSWTLFFIIFLMITIVMVTISWAIGKAQRTGEEVTAFLMFILMGAVAYIAYWGLPAGWTWAWAAVYLLVFGIVSAGATTSV